jgi:fluoroquinolone transport system permease protein
MTAGSGGLGQQRREPLHPPEDGDVVDLDTAFGEQFFDVPVGEAETQVPADRQHDHLGREAEASEGRSRDGSRARAAGSHDSSLPTQGSLAADATVPAPLLRLVPTVGAWELLQAGYTPIPTGRLLADAAYLTLWAAGAFVLAARRIASIDKASQPPAPTVALQRRTRPPRRAPRRLVPASIDATNAFRYPLALALAASPLVLAAAVRLGLPPFAAWLSRTHGVDLTGLEPLIFSGLILLHVPYIFGIVATLLLLDDLDEGGLRALSVSPLGVRGYLRYRTASTALAALLAVIAATVLAGPPDGIGWPRLGLAWLLAATCAPLVPLTTATMANNRVQGFGILKVLGIAYYLPLIGWTLYGWATLLVVAFPTYWPAALAWGEHSPNTLVLTLAGSGIAALAVIVELRLGERHLLRRIHAE